MEEEKIFNLFGIPIFQYEECEYSGLDATLYKKSIILDFGSLTKHFSNSGNFIYERKDGSFIIYNNNGDIICDGTWLDVPEFREKIKEKIKNFGTENLVQYNLENLVQYNLSSGLYQ